MNSNLRKILGSLLVITTLAPSALAQNQPDTNKTPRVSQTPQTVLATPNPKSREEWNDPEKVLPDLFLDGIPLEEVVEELKREFKNEFDVLLPFGSEEQSKWNWQNTALKLRLRNVKASEIFNAMNLVFEAGGTPLRWELMMNGRRPTALLRNLHLQAAADQAANSIPAEKDKPMVFFVGDLIGEKGSGGMTLEEVMETVSAVCTDALGQCNMTAHKQGQLLVFRGTSDEISFVQNTLSALRAKAQVDVNRQAEEKRMKQAHANEQFKQQSAQ